MKVFFRQEHRMFHPVLAVVAIPGCHTGDHDEFLIVSTAKGHNPKVSYELSPIIDSSFQEIEIDDNIGRALLNGYHASKALYWDVAYQGPHAHLFALHH